jgi:hypothetical protein
VPKKPNPSQKPTQQKKGVCQRKVPRPGKRTPPRHQKNKKKGLRQHKEPHQVLPNRNKARPRGQSYTLGVHKKAKAHKKPPEYTITEDDADLVAERVQTGS